MNRKPSAVALSSNLQRNANKGKTGAPHSLLSDDVEAEKEGEDIPVIQLHKNRERRTGVDSVNGPLSNPSKKSKKADNQNWFR